MSRLPQRDRTWSLRQLSFAAGVTEASARAAVKAGHLNPRALSSGDILVLRVAVMLPAFQPPGELRPANTSRETPQRDKDAIHLVRDSSGRLARGSTLLVFEDSASLAETFLASLEEAAGLLAAGRPYLAIPVGEWLHTISSGTSPAAAGLREA